MISLNDITVYGEDGKAVFSNASARFESESLYYTSATENTSAQAFFELLRLERLPRSGSITILDNQFVGQFIGTEHTTEGTDAKPANGKETLQQAARKLSKIDEVRRRSAHVSSQINLLPHLRLDENLILPLALRGAEIDHEAATDLLSWLNLTKRRHVLARDLNREEAALTRFGQAIILRPSLIIASDSLDDIALSAASDVIGLIEYLCSRGVCAIIATQRKRLQAKHPHSSIKFVRNEILLTR